MNTFTTTDGTTIYYKDWGSGPVVTFSHGWPLSSDAWDAQVLFLAQRGYRVVAHDRRGHGRSGQSWQGNNMDQYADDLAELMNHLDLEDATMVGHSTGGGEVVRYIARHGQERVLNAVLIAAVPPLFGDPRHIDVGDKVVLVGTLEHEDPDRVDSLGLLEERDQVADQIRTQKVHRGSCDFYKQDGFSLFTLSVSKFMSFSEAAAV